MIKTEFITKKGFDTLIRDIETRKKATKREVMKLGEETSEKMINVIEENKVRPQAGEPKELEDNLKVEKFDNGDVYGWSIGNISILDKLAPYWRAINYGSRHLVGKLLPLGFFSPGEAKPSSEHRREGRWKKGGPHTVRVKNPIPAMHYIEKTVFFFKQKLEDITQTFRQGR